MQPKRPSIWLHASIENASGKYRTLQISMGDVGSYPRAEEYWAAYLYSQISRFSINLDHRDGADTMPAGSKCTVDIDSLVNIVICSGVAFINYYGAVAIFSHNIDTVRG